MFRVTYNQETEQKIRQAAKLPGIKEGGNAFWKDLTDLVDLIAKSPTEIGEPKFAHKYVALRSYLVVRKFISMQYAVIEEHQFVFIERLNLSGDHPYSPEIEAILNPKKV